MKGELNGLTALVTGSSRGLGRSLALSLAQSGADLIICGRNKNKLIATQKLIKKFKTKVFFYSLDATKESQVNGLFRDIRKKIGKLDILVNNVGGVEKFGDFYSLKEKDWYESFSLNFMSVVYFSKLSIPLLKKSKNARIINLATVPARQPGLYNPHYSAAKAAVLNLNKHLANILAQNKILVNAICPSTLSGEDWQERIKDKANKLKIDYKKLKFDMEQEESQKIPLKRLGKPKEIANLVTFLCSERANYITGACFNIDGGVIKSIF